jgi:flagellar assembly factor FliW
MEIIGTRFGDIQVEHEKLLDFPEGIPGLEYLKQFALLHDENIAPFFWLQSIDQPEIALIVFDPFPLFPDYAPLLPEETVDFLGDAEPSDITLLVIALIPEDVRGMSCNLAAPLVVHSGKRKGVQALLERGAYQSRTPMYGNIVAHWKGGGGDAGTDA